ncbi:porin [Aliidiomarina sp. Khilg15.8]
MNTRPLLLAATLASVMAPAMATDIDVYGRAHVSIDALGDGEDTNLNLSSNASRLGFRATHEVQEGLEAFVQLEQKVRFDERGGDFATRDSYAGLRGNWGEVRVGSYDTPGKLLRAKVDVFNDRMGDLRNIASGNDMTFDTRFRNSMSYHSPEFANLRFNVQYSPHNETGATSDDRQAISTSLTYQAGDLYLAASYESYEVDLYTPKAFRLGSTYQFTDNWLMTAFYQRATDIVGGDRDVFGVGSNYQLGDYALVGQVYTSSDNDTPDTGATMYAIGVDRQMSEQLMLYVIYGVTTNDTLADFSVSDGGRDVAIAPYSGMNATGLSLGFLYNF